MLAVVIEPTTTLTASLCGWFDIQTLRPLVRNVVWLHLLSYIGEGSEYPFQLVIGAVRGKLTGPADYRQYPPSAYYFTTLVEY